MVLSNGFFQKQATKICVWSIYYCLFTYFWPNVGIKKKWFYFLFKARIPITSWGLQRYLVLAELPITELSWSNLSLVPSKKPQWRYVLNKICLLGCPGRMFSYCIRARAYTHVLAHVYSTRASACTIYTCFTLPHTRVNLTGLQLWGFQRALSFEIVEIVGIAVSVFVIIGWVGQIQYQKPRSK